MSVVAAAPLAARPSRPVVRRVVTTLLFLGGLLALAFLFGGTAHAATAGAGQGESAESAGLLEPGGSEDGSLAGHEQAEQQRAAEEAARDAASKVVEPVAEGAEGAAHLTRPVGETVAGVGEAVGLGALTDGLGLRPGDESGDDGSGGDSTPRPPGGDDAAGNETDGERSSLDRQFAPSLPDGRQGLPAGGDAQPPRAGDGAKEAGDGLPVPGHVPFQQAPSAPCAATSQQASDGNGPRGGGLLKLAALLTDAEQYGLLRPGAVSEEHGAPVRDRASEVLEFPG